MGEVFLRFYIFKGEGMKDNYIKFLKPSTCMTMQKSLGWFVSCSKSSYFYSKFIFYVESF
jgi:hypothetical protein